MAGHALSSCKFGFNELASQRKNCTKKGAAKVTGGANAITQFWECPLFWTLKFGVMGNTPSSPKVRIPWMELPTPEALKEAAANVTRAPIRTPNFQIPSQALEWQGMHQILLVSEFCWSNFADKQGYAHKWELAQAENVILGFNNMGNYLTGRKCGNPNLTTPIFRNPQSGNTPSSSKFRLSRIELPRPESLTEAPATVTKAPMG